MMQETFFAKDLEINLRKEPLAKPGPDHTYTFGGVTTDHMLEIDYDKFNGGWQKPKIVPNEPFDIDPSNASVHYAI